LSNPLWIVLRTGMKSWQQESAEGCVEDDRISEILHPLRGCMHNFFATPPSFQSSKNTQRDSSDIERSHWAVVWPTHDCCGELGCRKNRTCNSDGKSEIDDQLFPARQFRSLLWRAPAGRGLPYRL